MKSIKAALLLVTATVAMVAFIAPAAAQAEAASWTREGKALEEFEVSPPWAQEGKRLESKATATVEGPVEIFAEAVGSAECTVSGDLELEPGTAGQIDELAVPSVSNCKTTGIISTICGAVEEAFVEGPWAVSTNKDGTISIEGVNLVFQLEANTANCPNGGEWHISGNLTATPDHSQAIGNLSLSGLLTTTVGKFQAGGSLSVKPAGKYGMLPNKPLVGLNGNIRVGLESFGGFECETDASLELESSSSGSITSMSVHSCSVFGSMSIVCPELESVTFPNLPWKVTPEFNGAEYFVNITEAQVNWKWFGAPGCPHNEWAQGNVHAVPDNAFAISNTALGGTVSSSLGTGEIITGTLSWDPAALYGMQ